MDEGTLRERFPEIPWDQPLHVVTRRLKSKDVLYASVCRYCFFTYGVALAPKRGKRLEVDLDAVEFAFTSNTACMNHIERVHHD